MPGGTRDWRPIVFAGEADSAVLSRAVRRGTLRRIARSVYTSETGSEPADVVRRHLWQIIAHALPGAVIADRSVRSGGLPEDGALFVVHSRRRPLALPGVIVYPRPGPGPQPGDTPLPDGIWISSTQRALLDNLVPSVEVPPVGMPPVGVPPGAVADSRRTLTRLELETWIEQLLQQRGEDALNGIRDSARRIARSLRRETQMNELHKVISAALATARVDVDLVSPQLRARSAGRPYDTRRVESFAALATALRDSQPDIQPDLPEYAGRRALLPFFEAYFSNFIEGTEFTVDEAADIIFAGAVPGDRPQDAHDILGTYQIVADPTEMATVPRTSEGLLELLSTRHAILMGARAGTHPGLFKTRANRAGTTEFVVPDLVEGTLRQGFELAQDLPDPFSRAVYLMFLVAEVHPFDDGNGRIARIMMNAELVSAGEVRIIIPVVYRANYLAALKGATHNQNYGALIRMLSFARRYTARVDFSSRATAEADLTRTHAFDDPRDAEDAGVRLTLP